MSKTRIFLSSTCYDLRAVREHLRERIQELGHDLLASEYPSFPVAPDLSTVENCKKVVREHADLFVLVVGGRRGSLDPSGERSVVNAEYLEAKARRLDSFIFVDRRVMDLLPVFQKNPNADFTPVVDHQAVFKFVEELKAESRWIYTFEKTDDIITVLRTQLSVHLKTLMDRARIGSLDIPREFTHEPRSVLAIIQERPPLWEFLLAAELLEHAVRNCRRKIEELNDGAVYRPAESVADQNAMNRVSKFLDDMVNIIEALTPALAKIPPTFGPPGVSGDPVEIRNACRRVIALIEAAVEWETELRFIHVSDRFDPLFESLRGSTDELIDQLALIAPGIRDGVKKAQSEPGHHTIHILLEIQAPRTLERANEELRKLRAGLPDSDW